MAKASIVKWSRIWICIDKSPFSGLAILFENALKTEFIERFGCARNGTSSSGNQNLTPPYNIYFCHITNVKWSQICTWTVRKCFFCGYLIFSPISNWNLYCNRKFLHSPEKNRAREKTKTVLKSHWHGEQLGNMAITWSWLLYFKNHPTAVTPPPSTLIQFWGPPPLSTKSG